MVQSKSRISGELSRTWEKITGWSEDITRDSFTSLVAILNAGFTFRCGQVYLS